MQCEISHIQKPHPLKRKGFLLAKQKSLLLFSEIIAGYSEIMQNSQHKYISWEKCSSTKVKGNTGVHQARAAGPRGY
jgi:hypothetical protein